MTTIEARHVSELVLNMSDLHQLWEMLVYDGKMKISAVDCETVTKH